MKLLTVLMIVIATPCLASDPPATRPVIESIISPDSLRLSLQPQLETLVSPPQQMPRTVIYRELHVTGGLSEDLMQRELLMRPKGDLIDDRQR